MRARLTERHQPAFGALTGPEVALVFSRLVQHRALPREHLPLLPPESGEDLFAVCQEARLDHAGVVLTLARETSETGLSAIEHLVGRPVRPWAESTRPAVAVRRGVAVVRVRPEDSMIVVAHVPNPKRPQTAGWERFKIWRVGALVSEMIQAGMWPADVRWDLERSFVTLAPQSDPAAAAARQQFLAAQETAHVSA